MSIAYQRNKKTGVTYAYDSYEYWDKELKKHRSKRTLLGRYNEETGEITPTDGRCKNLAVTTTLPRTVKECRAEILKLREENERLALRVKELEELNKEREELASLSPAKD